MSIPLQQQSVRRTPATVTNNSDFHILTPLSCNCRMIIAYQSTGTVTYGEHIKTEVVHLNESYRKDKLSRWRKDALKKRDRARKKKENEEGNAPTEPPPFNAPRRPQKPLSSKIRRKPPQNLIPHGVSPHKIPTKYREWISRRGVPYSNRGRIRGGIPDSPTIGRCALLPPLRRVRHRDGVSR